MTEPNTEQPAVRGPVALLTGVEKTYTMDSVSVPVIKGVDILVRPA
ncbi:hypothetical protein M2244_004209, partial [Rhodoferax antarcticus]|nr:hypothetical protein [Rhodoferax antarcticus]